MQQTESIDQAEKLILALFVTPQNKDRAKANLAKVLGEPASILADVIELDVSAVPEVAEVAHIVATPTLIRYWPHPRLTVVGDLSNLEDVRSAIFGCTEPVTSNSNRSGERETLLNNLRSQSAGEVRRQHV